MSENIPESKPTSSDKYSHRPTKRQAITPTSIQSAKLSALFANPTQDLEVKAKCKGPAPPPEIVANVQGSSAGAGSGEFHVYKASRRREYERLRAMDAEVEAEQRDREYLAQREEMKRLDDEKTSRNRARREKARARKGRGKGSGSGGMERRDVDGDDALDEAEPGNTKTRLRANVVAGDGLAEPDGDEDAQIDDPPGGIVIHDDDI